MYEIIHGEAVYENGLSVAELRPRSQQLQLVGAASLPKDDRPPITVLASGLAPGLLTERVHCSPRNPHEFLNGDGSVVRNEGIDPLSERGIAETLARVKALMSKAHLIN